MPPPDEEIERLPRGRHGLSAEFVARNQRERLISAVTLTLADVGYQKTTVAVIGKRAAVSKSDFYKHFDSKDSCFLAAYDAAVERVRAAVLDACTGADPTGWPNRVRAALAAVLQLLAAEPERWFCASRFHRHIAGSSLVWRIRDDFQRKRIGPRRRQRREAI